MSDHIRRLSEGAALTVRARGDEFTVKVAKAFSQLGKELNRVTGYEEIDALKRRVVQQEARINEARATAKAAKAAYDDAVRQRAASQREVNELLQRKSGWTDGDVGRFTALVREDHAREQTEARAKADAHLAEDAVEREFSALMRVILNRYHEEQAWSDKIRSASTYGSLAALGLNVVVFVLAIVLVEPWKRRRLAQTFERKVEEMSRETARAFEGRTEELKARMDEHARVLAVIAETVSLSAQVSDAGLAALDESDVAALDAEDAPRAQAPRTDQATYITIAASATAAGVLGWIARSWYG